LALALLFHRRDMKGCNFFVAGVLASFAAVSASQGAVTSSFPAMDSQRAAGRTNWVENTITNLIEVRMSRNRFVDEYRTNWVEHVTTNVFDVYRTNQLTRNLTNRFIVDAWRTNSVDAFRTNIVDSYHTNWLSRNLTNDIVLTRFQTNFVDSYRTNWKQLTHTNQVAINLVRTNLADVYKTNWQHVTVTNEVVVDRVHTNFVNAFATNWQTVVVTKTNWVTQFATNVVQQNVPRTVSVAHAAPEKRPVAHAAPPAATGSDNSDDPVIEVSRTTRPPANGQVEVELKIRWPAGTVDAPPVRQWRIERQDGAFLSFGMEQECRRELPVGHYIVEAQLQRDADSPSFVLKGTLSVSIKEAVVQQRTDRSKLAAVGSR
jgi:hypothetical protein